MSATRTRSHLYGDLVYSDRPLASRGYTPGVAATPPNGAIGEANCGVVQSGGPAASRKPGADDYRTQAGIAGRAIAAIGLVAGLYLTMLPEITKAIGPEWAGFLLVVALSFVGYLAYLPWLTIKESQAKYTALLQDAMNDKAQHSAALLRTYQQGMKDGMAIVAANDEPRTPAGGTRIRREEGG